MEKGRTAEDDKLAQEITRMCMRIDDAMRGYKGPGAKALGMVQLFMLLDDKQALARLDAIADEVSIKFTNKSEEIHDKKNKD